MKVITVKTKDGSTHNRYLFDTTKESCPLCDAPLEDTYVSWNIFHGEVSRSCCNSNWQIKSFSPPEGDEKAFSEYFDELNKTEMAELKVKHALWPKIRDAFKSLNIIDCKNKDVIDYVLREEIVK